MDETVALGVADAAGRFQIPLEALRAKLGDLQQGDVLRIRSRTGDGTTPFATLKAAGLGELDTRNAQVALFRIGLRAVEGGRVAVTNINPGRQISEPGARLQFANLRTGERAEVVLNDQGSFANDATLPGAAGDTFGLAASDGVNDPGFALEVGRLAVPKVEGGDEDPYPDPALHHEERSADGTPRFGKKLFSGPVFQAGAGPEDPQQGQIGNCFFPAAAAAVAYARPALLEGLIDVRLNPQGRLYYEVTLKKVAFDGTVQEHRLPIDGELWVRPTGAPLYGATAGKDKGERTMELWYPLLEKALADLQDDSYERMGNGGTARDALELLTGVRAESKPLSATQVDGAWNLVKLCTERRWPLCASTHGKDRREQYRNTGIYANHAYSVLGFEEKDGKRQVRLRNPWGSSEPRGGDEVNDGIFLLDLERFCQLFSGAHFTPL